LRVSKRNKKEIKIIKTKKGHYILDVYSKEVFRYTSKGSALILYQEQ